MPYNILNMTLCSVSTYDSRITAVEAVVNYTTQGWFDSFALLYIKYSPVQRVQIGELGAPISVLLSMKSHSF